MSVLAGKNNANIMNYLNNMFYDETKILCKRPYCAHFYLFIWRYVF